jgi:hypothetical protein
MNYRLISLCIIFFCTFAKICSFYWIFVILSSILVAILGFLSVFLSSCPEKSLKVSLRNPLEDQQLQSRLGLNCNESFE